MTDNEEDLFDLPEMETVQAAWTVCTLPVPAWAQALIDKDKLVLHAEGCLVWCGYAYILAHPGQLIALLGSGVTILTTEPIQ